MSLWRPPRTMNERALRAIRSMQNGSIDGSIVSAQPVTNYSMFEDLLDNSDEDQTTSEDDLQDPLEPWTDTFTVKDTRVLKYTLSRLPYRQPKMAEGARNKSTVHIYWNGVFQKDASYRLQSKLLTITNAGKRIRVGDVLTVKYWFNDTEDTENEYEVIPLDVWVSSTPREIPSGLFPSGFEIAPTIGQNGGIIVHASHMFVNLHFGAGQHISYGYQYPSGVGPINTTDASFEFAVEWDRELTMGIGGKKFVPENPTIGDIIYQKDGCGGIWSFGGDFVGIPPEWVVEPPGPFIPSPGPVGGEIFSDGVDALRLVRSLNNGLSQSAMVSIPKIRAPWNALGDCGGKQCGCCWNTGLFEGLAICNDDSVRGKQSIIRKSYDAKVGVTLYIERTLE